ncbi:unnamed protein product [Paramecium octaurelia]|uniref:Uncharacterized protein n=1 Tax=Paramecium octaurelia TaxID=43137 RepID=A0A8S1XFD8_PAROT|nr:unnamed protein product [Paramecium octaurelia]
MNGHLNHKIQAELYKLVPPWLCNLVLIKFIAPQDKNIYNKQLKEKQMMIPVIKLIFKLFSNLILQGFFFQQNNNLILMPLNSICIIILAQIFMRI